MRSQDGASLALGSIRVYGTWRSLVARIVRDDEVAGSNPAVPTNSPPSERVVPHFRKECRFRGIDPPRVGTSSTSYSGGCMTFDDSSSGSQEPSGSGGALGKMTTSELLVGAGALLIIIVPYLIAGVFLDEWAPGSLTWGTAMLALAAILARRFTGWRIPVDYSWVVIFLGYAAGVLGIRELIADIEESFIDGSNVIFALSVYIGTALMAFGAFQASRGDKGLL